MNKILHVFICLFLFSCGENGSKKTEKAAINWDDILPQDKSSDANAVTVEDPNRANFSNCYKKNPKLLILDFNQGWWSGLGRGTHEYIVEEIKKEACQTDIELTYLYLKNPGEMNQKFSSYNKDKFTQVWILSDDLKGMNLSAGEISANFRKIASWNKPMFIASGEGRSEIANLYARELQLNSFFTDIYSSRSSNLDLSKEFRRQSTIDTRSSQSNLFKDAPILLDQLVQERVDITKSGRISSGLEENISLSNCNSKYSCISIYKKNIILDAGFQRSYGVLRSDFADDTKNYLYNAIRLLSKD